MRNWREIDGFLNEESAAVVEKQVAQVPEDGWIVEIGCFKGRQSALIASCKKNSVRLSCIDPFPDTHIAFDDSQTYKNYSYSDWVTNMAGYTNVEAVRNFSPFNISFVQFTRSPDLVIFNVDRVYDSLNFWSAHMSKTAKFLVHTYNYEHSRIVTQVEQFLEKKTYIHEMHGAAALLERKN